MPPVMDLNDKDTVEVALKKPDSWVKVEQNGNLDIKLNFELDKMLPGDFSLTIRVSDQTGTYSQYIVKYKVIEKLIEESTLEST
jgi:hypothetical protein